MFTQRLTRLPSKSASVSLHFKLLMVTAVGSNAPRAWLQAQKGHGLPALSAGRAATGSGRAPRKAVHRHGPRAEAKQPA